VIGSAPRRLLESVHRDRADGDRRPSAPLLLTRSAREPCADEAAVRQAVHETTERFGHLNAVVNNAGYGFLAAVEETSE
jgi:NAD(P)-dependent dehydrogenase (short-subunit alcohol dehydrogenase family)